MKHRLISALLTATSMFPLASAEAQAPAAPASSAATTAAIAAATSPIPIMMGAHVRVTDMARAERFYREVFGMVVASAPSAREHFLRMPGTSALTSSVILLLADKPQPNGGFLLQVPDIAAASARVVPAGGTLTRGPMPPAGNSPVINAMIADPDGTRIELMQFIKR